jgi:hypothetical protein
MPNRKGPRRHQVRFDEWGVPIDAQDWTEHDWQDLHVAIQWVRARIAKRHAGGKISEVGRLRLED